MGAFLGSIHLLLPVCLSTQMALIAYVIKHYFSLLLPLSHGRTLMGWKLIYIYDYHCLSWKLYTDDSYCLYDQVLSLSTSPSV